LHAINVSTGTEITNGTSVPYDLSSVFHTGINAKQELQRAGLALFNASPGTANLYVGFGSFCDQIPYSGYLAGLTYNYTSQTFAPVSSTKWVFDTQSGAIRQQGGIWMAGSAPAVDSVGNVYVAVSNGNWNGTTLFGQSVVKIATTSSGLVPVDYYTPNDYQDLNKPAARVTLCSTFESGSCPTTNLLTLPTSGDFDLGSGGVTLISPAGAPSACGSNAELIAGGKEGVIYGICYSNQTGSTLESVMGGLDGCGYNCTDFDDPTISACVQSSTPGSGAIAQCFQGVNTGENQSNGSNNIFAAPGIRGPEAFWAGSAASPQNYLYAAGGHAALTAFQVNPVTGLFNPVGDAAKIPSTYPYPGTIASISWNGSDPTTAVLWTINSGGYGGWQSNTNSSQAAKPAILVAYNPIPSGSPAVLKELWESSTLAANAGPAAVKFTVPTVAGGLVFVPGGAAGYAPGPPGEKGVNCTAAALVTTTTPTVCGGQLSIYGKLHL